MSDKAMEVANALLRLGALSRDDPEHRVIYEDLTRDPVFFEDVRARLDAVGYDLVEDLGHLGVRVSGGAESAYLTWNRMGLNSAHIRTIVYLWTQLIYREAEQLKHGMQVAVSETRELFESVGGSPSVSYRSVLNDFAQAMSGPHIKRTLTTLKRLRFIGFDERKDRIWADAALYVQVDRQRMADFVTEIARRLGRAEAADAIVEVVAGGGIVHESDSAGEDE